VLLWEKKSEIPSVEVTPPEPDPEPDPGTEPDPDSDTPGKVAGDYEDPDDTPADETPDTPDEPETPGQVAGDFEEPTDNTLADTPVSNDEGVTDDTHQKSSNVIKAQLAKTGDTALVAVGAFAAVALVAGAGALALRRTRRKY
jgi:LPXTG-motif cell wall-anchored protein